MLYQKSFNIAEQNILPRVKNALVAKGFKVLNENNNSLQAERGSSFAQIYSLVISGIRNLEEVQYPYDYEEKERFQLRG